MKYKVEPLTTTNCDCKDCKAGKHLYSLYRWTENEWTFTAMSLQSYVSAQECQRNHWWGIGIGPEDTWEDGTPVVEPAMETPPSTGGEVVLDNVELQQSLEALEKHWVR